MRQHFHPNLAARFWPEGPGSYGWYSNKSRGLRNKQEKPLPVDDEIKIQEPTAGQKEYRKTWAMLLRKVWEVDPLICPKCKGPMKVIAVINDGAVISKA